MLVYFLVFRPVAHRLQQGGHRYRCVPCQAMAAADGLCMVQSWFGARSVQGVRAPWRLIMAPRNLPHCRKLMLGEGKAGSGIASLADPAQVSPPCHVFASAARLPLCCGFIRLFRLIIARCVMAQTRSHRGQMT
ncbi:hypothetical protein M8818_005974 [Zalaria obscura]|uniref:Uncharacterized protein n=1 Tax=Zalaria obscura TaxID=2024903 RepID=A0ACC3S9R2_9PEZI